jgi:hypothetical protein
MRLPSSLALVLVAAGPLADCKSHDPKQELEVAGVETYWVLDSPRGGTQYMAPAVRFRVHNKSPEPILSIQATATFRRVGEDENWGSAWEQVTPVKKPLPPGKDVVVVLRSDGHYTSSGAADSMFAHPQFKDTRAEVFLRVGSSGWVKMAESPIERRVGSKTVEPLAAP